MSSSLPSLYVTRMMEESQLTTADAGLIIVAASFIIASVCCVRYKHRGKGQNHSLGSNVQVKRTLNQEKEAQREGVHTRGTVKRPRIDSAGYALVMSKDEVRFVCVERTEYSHIGEGTAQSLTRSMSKAYDHVMPKGSTRRATKTVEEKEVDIVCSGEAEEPFENHYDVSAVVPHDNRYEVIGEVYDRLIY